MKTIVHVNQHKIKANRKLDPIKQRNEIEPVLTCKTYKTNRYGMEAIIKDKDGNELGRFVYRPHKPLSCGAHVWFETENEVEVI